MTKAFTFIIGWLAFILIMIAIAKTEVGNRIIYYALWLGVLFLIVTQYKFFANLLGGTGTLTGTGGAKK